MASFFHGTDAGSFILKMNSVMIKLETLNAEEVSAKEKKVTDAMIAQGVI